MVPRGETKFGHGADNKLAVLEELGCATTSLLDDCNTNKLAVLEET